MKQNITRIHSVPKREDQNLEPLLEWLLTKGYKIEKYEAINEQPNKKTPDYLLGEDMLVEVKALHDSERTKRSAQWGIVTNKLQTILTAKYQEANLSGLYSIETPDVYKLVGKNSFDKVASELIDAITKNKVDVLSQGINFTIKKINHEDYGVYLVSFSGANSINPAGTIFQNIVDKLATANEQLGYQYKSYSINKRCVLLVNKYIFADRISEVVEALSYLYERNKLLDWNNIDEIWFQQETKDGKYIHTKIYDQEFLTKFDSFQINPARKENWEQFELWYWALDKIEERKEQIWNALSKFLRVHKADKIFPDPYKREMMTRMGLWLLEKDRVDDATWLIDRFISDPDPTETTKTEKSEKSDFQERIIQGQDPAIITTVMGHLAWVVKELATKSGRHDTKNLETAYTYTKKVLSERKNLYTILEWLTPLAEIANRRMFLLEDHPELYKDLHDLLLDTRNGLVAKYSGYSALAKHLVLIFYYFKELTTKEAVFVLNHLQTAEQGEFLLVYLALYRSGHFKETMEIGPALKKTSPEVLSFDPSYAQEKLGDVLTYSGNEYKLQELRASAAWQIWKILKDSPKEFCHLAKWIDLIFSGPYYPRLGTTQGQIMEDWYGEEVEGCTNPSGSWPERYLNAALEYSQSHKGEVYLYGIESILPALAVNQPKELVPSLSTLTEIRMNGGYVGELANIYTAWEDMKDPKEKERAGKAAQRLYNKLKKANPKIPDLKFRT